MMFQIGDRIIHPGHDAGTVVKIEKLPCLGSNKLYYSIELLAESKTHVWILVKDAEEKEVRHPMPKSELSRIWRVLRSEPETLSSDHKERYDGAAQARAPAQASGPQGRRPVPPPARGA